MTVWMDDRSTWPGSGLLGTLGPVERAALLQLGRSRTHEPGEILVKEGEEHREVYVLLHGYVKVVSNSRDGRSVLLAVRGRGDLIGEIAAMDDKPRTATGVAATTVESRVIGHGAFAAYRTAHPAAERAIQDYLLRKLRQATMVRSALNGAPVSQRLAQVLCHLGVNHGRRVGTATVIDIPLSQRELATFVGAAEPSVQRALGQFRRAGLLLTHYRRIEIRDMQALATHAATG
ncbi:Crp/Fnr family transcriptional regulator [Micromonospora sp. HUAS LYJ1]|uniref:Crp/Fnr family transcriptional regulator n=1 Tax=Micromonospora sp. HUAS LYJ1 TaxID=3061626 RepID=UPI00267321D9|nr:Crp/Fnr family transcriptional regulator [Micromonospora sp. HUAS LYJ1]WKU05688.1 Crp/Fnr family transcriptional regulator [Micromonospora sp. HUAS LYJ1]